jgi:hypothetical protein
MDASTAAHTHLLGTYRTGSIERQVLALETDEDGIFAMVDVLAAPVDGCDDPRGVEHRVTSLGECHSIAEDYIRLATELGVPPMPNAWW